MFLPVPVDLESYTHTYISLCYQNQSHHCLFFSSTVILPVTFISLIASLWPLPQPLIPFHSLEGQLPFLLTFWFPGYFPSYVPFLVYPAGVRVSLKFLTPCSPITLSSIFDRSGYLFFCAHGCPQTLGLFVVS